MAIYSIWMLIPILAAALLFLVIPIMIGMYVYRDATLRGMNAVLWTLIAVFSPTFIGLIIYLIVRNDHTTLKCPKCQYPVTDHYAICPQCGTQLKSRCQRCNSPIESSWEVCAICGEPVAEESRSAAVGVQNDKWLGKILFAAILIPFIVVSVLAFGLVAYRGTFSTSSIGTVSGMNIEDYYENKTISSWIEDLKLTEDGIYVLEHQVTTGDNTRTNYIVYYKGTPNMLDFSAEGLSRSFFKSSTLKISYNSISGGQSPDYVISQVDYVTKDVPILEIYVDGKKVDYKLTRTSEPISFNENFSWKPYVEDLFASKTDYIGDNSAVAQLIKKTGFGALGNYSIELETNMEPYGLRIIYSPSVEGISELDHSLDATLLLGLVKNLGYVEVISGDFSYTLSSSDSTDTLGYDVKDLGESRENLMEFLENLGN
ncbi:MAG: DUF4825 domain-containing protein [Youngiibacter sp.]|nr:DUF4825 domain-containing protein [Youngiibacter sp.]